MVYTPFAATGLGLGAIAIISMLDGWEWWKARKEKIAATTTVQAFSSDVGNIQTGMAINTLVVVIVVHVHTPKGQRCIIIGTFFRAAGTPNTTKFYE